MSVQDFISGNTSKMYDAINSAVDGIISSSSVASSPFSSIIHLFAWIVIIICLTVIFRGLLAFSIKQSIGIIQEIMKARAIWRKGRERFPNFVFDPFDEISVSRTRIHGKFSTKMWSFFGTQKEFMHDLKVREVSARKIYAISIFATVTMAIIGAFSFVKDMTASSELGFFASTFAIAIGCLIYSSVIYAFDLSIITSRNITFLKMMGRLIFAVIMAVIVGTQMNIEFHKDYLVNMRKSELKIEDLKKKLNQLEGDKGKAEKDNVGIDAILLNYQSIVTSVSSVNPIQSSLSADITNLQNDIKTLKCMLNGERSSGDFSGCNPPANHYGLSLNLDPNRGRGPKSPDCSVNHVRTNYCKIFGEISSKTSELSSKNSQLSNQQNPIARGDYISGINDKMEALNTKRANNEKTINENKNEIERLGIEIKEKENLSVSSKTDLVREMIKTVSKDLGGEGDGSSYWMIALFVVITIIDLFAVLAKMLVKSEVYDQRISRFEDEELQQSGEFGRRFKSRIGDNHPPIEDIDDYMERDNSEADHASDHRDQKAKSTVQKLKDMILKKINEKIE